MTETVDFRKVQTETLSLTAMPLANGYVKAMTYSTTSNDVYKAVYESQVLALR